jgi:hypothetical protein
MIARSTFRPLLLAIAAVLLVGAAPVAAFNPQPDPPGSAHPERVFIGAETNSAAFQGSGTGAVADSEDPHARTLIRGDVN